MTKYEQLKNRVDRLERGIIAREMSTEMATFWLFKYYHLKKQLDEMTVEEAGQEV
jgi:hypothetical protein